MGEDSDLEENIQMIADNVGPEETIRYLASEVESLSKPEAREVVKDALPRTEGPGRHAMEYCMICNPDWNGSFGEPGTEAIGKYKVENKTGIDQISTGWHGACEDCVRGIQHRRDVIPFPEYEDHPLFREESTSSPEHECVNPSWTKVSLVTEVGGFDWVKCETCGIWAKRHGPDSYEIVGYEDPR